LPIALRRSDSSRQHSYWVFLLLLLLDFFFRCFPHSSCYDYLLPSLLLLLSVDLFNSCRSSFSQLMLFKFRLNMKEGKKKKKKKTTEHDSERASEKKKTWADGNGWMAE
jgi:hypothetical protein